MVPSVRRDSRTASAALRRSPRTSVMSLASFLGFLQRSRELGWSGELLAEPPGPADLRRTTVDHATNARARRALELRDGLQPAEPLFGCGGDGLSDRVLRSVFERSREPQ